MKYFFIFLFLINHSLAVEIKKNSLIFLFENMVGDNGKSINGSYMYSLSFKGNKDWGAFKGSLGGSFFYSKAALNINETSYFSTVYGGEFLPGLIFMPIKENTVNPFIELNLCLGTTFLEMASAPTGMNTQFLSLHYGYQIGFGTQIDISRKHTIRLGAQYINRTALKLANEKNFSLNSFSLNFGYLF